MEYHKFQHTFSDIMPIMYKAAPIVAGYIGSPITYIIIGLLAAVTQCDACDHEEIANKLQDDPDLYAKLEKLESTHAEWLNSLQKN